MRYCKPCATRNGWAFDPDSVRFPSNCQTCNGLKYVSCMDVPVAKLRVPGEGPLDQRVALFAVVAWCEQQLKDAWDNLLEAVGDQAAQKARIDAIKKEGWAEHYIPGLGPTTDEQQKILETKITIRRKEWRERFYAYKKVFEMTYGNKE